MPRWVGNIKNAFSGMKSNPVGKGIYEFGRDTGKDAWAAGAVLWRTRHTKATQWGLFGATLAVGTVTFDDGNVTPMADLKNYGKDYGKPEQLGFHLRTPYEAGKQEAKYTKERDALLANASTSSDGGGTFLRNNFSPNVDDLGATGDLVFALHNLRNGGQ